MPGFRLDQFAGEQPKLNRHKLPGPNAQLAQDVQLWSGALAPLRGTATVQATTTAGTAQTIFQYRPDGTWFEWGSKVYAVHSPVADDQYERVMYTGVGGEPKVTSASQALSATPYPAASYRLGVPAAGSAPTGAITGTSDDAAETRFYVVTLVNSWGEEGAPSPVSDELEVKPGQGVDLTLPSVPAGNYDFSTWRVYRTNTSANNAAFQYVGETSIANSTFSDSVPSAQLGEVLPSEEWDEPPDDLEGLVSMPGGFLAGFRGNQVLFSLPGLPHAWPVRLRFSVDYPIVALGVLANGVAILTEGQPYVAQGTNPAAISLAQLSKPYACSSADSVATVNGSVIYASPVGLIMVAGTQAALLTQDTFDRTDFQALTPSSMKGFEWLGLYVCFYNNGSDGGFLIDPRSPAGGIVTLSGYAVDCGYSAPEDTELYLVVSGDIVKWDAGSELTYKWKSRPVAVRAPRPLNVVQVFAEAYPVTITITRDGVRQVKMDIGSNEPRRIREPLRGYEFEVEVSAATEVYEVAVASSMQALKEI